MLAISEAMAIERMGWNFGFAMAHNYAMYHLNYIILLALGCLLIGCGGKDPTVCYYCKDEVKIGAKKCKHCGEDPYAGNDQSRMAGQINDRTENTAKRKMVIEKVLIHVREKDYKDARLEVAAYQGSDKRQK